MVVMASSKTNFLLAFFFFASISLAASNSNLFREYIGADTGNITFCDVPVNPDVDFHFILSFAVDYTLSSPHFPTDGIFAAAWDTAHLTPCGVAAVKRRHANVKVALSLGGDSLGDINVYFVPSSIDSWVHNAVTSLTAIIRQYGLDGIDIDYEHFVSDPDTFAECVGRLLATLKAGGLISFASIAPFDDDEVQSHYLALWRKYGHLIDYVNFQFYAYSANTTVPEFLSYFEAQRTNYGGGKLMASFTTDKSSEGGLSPERGFFNASRTLKTEGKLDGIFIWSADDSRSDGFRYELQSQELLTNPC